MSEQVSYHSQLLAEMFRQMLAMRNMKQYELAEKVGLSRSYLNQLLQGKRECSVQLMFRLIDALGFDSNLAVWPLELEEAPEGETVQ